MGLFDSMLGTKASGASQMPGAQERFNQLKTKYQSALTALEKEKVQLQNLHIENEKLYVKGTAPTDAAKNTVWDQVKRVDPAYADLTLDLDVAPQGAGATATSPMMETYTVKAGDSLSKIAQQYYGDMKAYPKIFDANRDILNDPNLIQPGQRLKIPKA